MAGSPNDAEQTVGVEGDAGRVLGDDDARLAAAAVREAGRLAAAMRARGLRTDTKTSITDVVTDADHAAEKLIGDRLAAARPRDGIVGEEGTSVPGGRTWFVDPVDGTYNFMSGLPEWCSALALVDGEELLLGAVYQPAVDELWLGGRDIATTRSGEPVPRLVPRPLREISLASYLHGPAVNDDALREPWLRVVRAAATHRMLGSGSVELAAVAAGRIGAWLHPAAPAWDWLPGAALVRAAGGVAEVFESAGRRWHAAGNAQAVSEVVELVGGG